LPDPKPFGVQPLDAIAFLKNKLNVPTARWNDIWQDMHGAAFMVAGAQKAALIEDFHAAVTSAIENGSTLATFRKDFDQIVAKHGWDYNGSRNWRSKIIYRTNMDMARSAGQWASIQRTKKSRPYIRYDAVMDGRTRPQHRAWNDIVLPVDHPFWQTHYPPNGWLCRCQPRSLSERDLKRQGLKVSDDPKIIWEDREVKRGDQIATIRVPQGIHSGFAYNPGLAGFGRGPNADALARWGYMDPLDIPGALTAKEYGDLNLEQAGYRMMPIAKTQEQAHDILREVIGGEEAVFIDPTGSRIRVTQALVDHFWQNNDPAKMTRERFFGLIPDLIENPAEIWVGFARSNVTRQVFLRRRFVKFIKLDKSRTLIMVADEVHGEWLGVTFYHGKKSALKNARIGLRIYSRDGN